MGIGDRQGRRTSYGNPGTVFNSLAEYQKNREYHEQALAFAIEIGERKGKGTSNGDLGTVFYSLR